jgi:hypothetical protein
MLKSVNLLFDSSKLKAGEVHYKNTTRLVTLKYKYQGQDSDFQILVLKYWECIT